MAPLLFLLITTLIVYTTGRFSQAAARHGLGTWPVAIRFGLAVMFVVTGISHFVGMREALIDMMPPWLPGAPAIVTTTGVLELLGAIGLLLGPTRPWAAGGLGLMLILMFPANVHLALTGENLPWDDQLVPRTLMQILFLAAVLAVLIPDIRARIGAHRQRGSSAVTKPSAP
ncbi:MAG: DoxX family protein [Actinomycetota bacterium]